MASENYKKMLLQELRQRLKAAGVVCLAGARGIGKRRLAARLAAETVGDGWLEVNLEDPRLRPGPRLSTLELLTASFSGSLLVLNQPELAGGWPRWALDFSSTRGVSVLAVQAGNPELLTRTLSGTGCDVVEMSAPDLLDYDEMDDASFNKEKLASLLENGWSHSGTATGQTGGMEGGRPPSSRGRHSDLLYEIIMKDIILATEVRDIAKLIDISLYLLENTGATFSFSEMRRHGMGSIDKIRSFVGAVERAGLVSVVERLDDGGRDRNQARRTCFAFDTGFAAALSRTKLSDFQLLWTALYWSLRRRSRSVRTLRSRWGDGFLVECDPGRIAILYDVESPTRCRGKAFARFLKSLGAARAIVLCEEEFDSVVRQDCTVTFEDPWRWIPKPDLGSRTVGTISTPVNGSTERGGESENEDTLPVHLL